MPEEMVWRGASSQRKNIVPYMLWAVFAGVVVVISLISRSAGSQNVAGFSSFVLLLLLVPIFMVLARYLQTKTRIYELTTERLKTTQGVFSRVTDTLELYRVKDLETRQPFFYRLLGVENVQLNTSDTSTPFIFIEAIPRSVGLGDKIRNQVEIIRQQKGVREIDIE